MRSKSKIRFLILLIIFTTFSFNGLNAQVSIVSLNNSPYNITPRGLLDMHVLNNKAEVPGVVITAKILGSNNEVLMSVTSNPFVLKTGMVDISQVSVTVASVVYANNNQGTLLRTSHSLPSGKFNYCASITAVDIADDYCQDLEAESSYFLFLVFPPDKEEIETKNPVLTWTHSDPFIVNNQNEYYRIMVVDLNEGQSAEAAINTNMPVYMKNNLTAHQVLYPIDAKELQTGKRYAWQVQKIYNGAIANKTEAWEFKLKAPDPIKENKYATVKKVLDGTFYKAEGNKVFFKFDEGSTGNILSYRILNQKQELVTISEDQKKLGHIDLDAVKTGYNQFCINLNEYKMAAGLYVLEVITERKEVFKLKFSAE